MKNTSLETLFKPICYAHSLPRRTRFYRNNNKLPYLLFKQVVKSLLEFTLILRDLFNYREFSIYFAFFFQ